MKKAAAPDSGRYIIPDPCAAASSFPLFILTVSEPDILSISYRYDRFSSPALRPLPQEQISAKYLLQIHWHYKDTAHP